MHHQGVSVHPLLQDSPSLLPLQCYQHHFTVVIVIMIVVVNLGCE